MSTLILLSAIPGSGKSTWAHQYASTHSDVFIVSSDGIRERLFGAPNNFSDEPRVWEIFLEEIHRYGSDPKATVIADSTNLSNFYRRYYVEETPEYSKHVLVLFHIPFEICKKQNRLRTGPRLVPEEAMERMHAQFEKPNQATLDLFDECITIEKSFIAPEIQGEKK